MMRAITPLWIARNQNRLLSWLGSHADKRADLVIAMMRRDVPETTSYWLQLAVSVGIATLGLALGSAAVIIGAMLVAPLMGPILGLAMGLASGSPVLVLRSSARVAGSIALVIAGAAAITLLLPYRELNGELQARAFPTALDLVTAGFCALAGVYSALRPGSETATAAAGTSIGISLVPPLCVCGYGLGSGTWDISTGAALLFMANMVSIVAIGTLAFVATGFNRVDVLDVERQCVTPKSERESVIDPAARRLVDLFDSKFGSTLRLLMPLVFLGIVYLPLRTALNDVVWQAEARSSARAALREIDNVIESRIDITPRAVAMVLVLAGADKDAVAARAIIDAKLTADTGVRPSLEVVAVPTASDFSSLTSTLQRPVAAPPPTIPVSQVIRSATANVFAQVASLFPEESGNTLAAVSVQREMVASPDKPGPASAVPANTLLISIVQLGPPLAPAVLETMRRALAPTLGDVIFADVALPIEPLRRATDDQFLMDIRQRLALLEGLSGIHVCLASPPSPPPATSAAGKKRLAADLALRARIDELLASHALVERNAGDAWTFRLSASPCSPAAAPAPWLEHNASQQTPGTSP